MNRREVLRYTAWIVGGSVATPISTSLLSGCQSAPKEIPFAPKFFTTKQFEFIKNVASTILPDGEIPGAIEVGVHQVIDHMVGVVFSQEDRDLYVKGLELLIHSFDQKNPQSFAEMSLEERNQIIANFELELKNPEFTTSTLSDVKNILLEKESAEALTTDQENAVSKEIYSQLKQQCIAYFLSSEEIGTNHLNYLPVPGKYEACISLESVEGKAWAI